MRSFAFVALFAIACDDPLSEAQRIERTRVLGARVEAGGDASRAWPKLDESVSVRFWVADPRPIPPLGWALSVCEAAPTTRGVPECAAPPFVEATSPAVSPDPPAIDFVVPSVVPGRLLVWGAVCGDGIPLLGSSLESVRCDGDLTRVALPVEIEREPPGNTNPSLADELLTFDDAPWPAPPLATSGRLDCTSVDAAPELPLVSTGSGDHRLTVTASIDDRNPGEELWLSHFSTGGRLERALSVIDDSVELRWKAPASVEAGGTIVRFYFALRDLRGGADFTLRTVCVVP